ncbi:DUF2442 domain-containing protein [Rhizobium sp. SGZ-381]|uniref:DUF2442 domain-containing protein n=1 Tax=Rhizobium sp. SGZ-381 TaxID=3342800 RepID=UPI00366CF2F1
MDIDEKQLLIADVDVGTDTVVFKMMDGRKIEAPLWWYPRLHAASASERKNWEILPFGDAVGWENLDEYISAKALIVGGAAPGAKPPAEAAE